MTQADPTTSTVKPGPAPKRRKVSHVKAAAGLLLKESRRILKKHAARIAAVPADAIRESVDRLERQREAGAWEQVEDECERLDELLHQHASFARKSAARETIENIGIAILVALALRSCLYEPFKIPSGSMMPTLRSGDHIFVNKFAYGIQIPFTTTVVGGFMGAPRRGDVIVFRYPVDESEDFIKRVIGLPGDTVRVEGNKVSIKREGDADFEELERTKLPEKCLDDAGESTVPHCALYEEHIDGRSYVVRYMSSADPRLGGQRRFGEWTVPPEHFLVMGDNRNQSHDSLAWTRQVEAVTADGLLGVKDLRDLTPEKLFTLSRPDETNTREDSSYDHVVYMADHASDAHELRLELWRDPVLGTTPVFETLVAQLSTPATDAAPTIKRGSFADLWNVPGIENDSQKARLARLKAAGASIGEVAWTRGEVAYEAVVQLPSARAVLQIRCGLAVCRKDLWLADQIAEVVARFDRDRSADARALLEGDREIRYTPHWTSRGPRADKFVERSYGPAVGPAVRPATQTPEPTAAGLVRLRAWRAPDEPETFLRDAALRAAGSSREQAKQIIDETFDDAWLARDDDKFTFVRVDATAQVVFVLECGEQRCASEADALTLARAVQARVPAASKDRSRLPELLTPSDLPGWKELTPTTPPPERDEYDRLRLDGSIRDAAYSVDIEVWLRPIEGLEIKRAALAAEITGGAPDEGVAPGAVSGPLSVGQGTQFVFAAPATESLVRLRCSSGLCPSPAEARALATRAYQKAQDAGNFIDPTAERPRPYVPRGNVKGRAERIWLPPNRFWLPVR
ncbi:signal peptidase I [Nannocystis sp.]|uniref:signal peptidase I n=1 Tax=Nannocystis sp. TaxID=1962667 RepID=UPI0025F5D130|nr:signal peptidase I [Nannocystis sp.]MBK7824094.1 signal peptidase I [Nannocystis sp.]